MRRIPCTTFELTPDVVGRWHRVADADRSFALRQLEPAEADGSEWMFQRAVLLIAGERVRAPEVRAWWMRIGPRGRAAVRLCFYALHQPTENVCTPEVAGVMKRGC